MDGTVVCGHGRGKRTFNEEVVQPCITRYHEVDGAIFIWFKMKREKLVADDWMAFKPFQWQILRGLEHLDRPVCHILRQV